MSEPPVLKSGQVDLGEPPCLSLPAGNTEPASKWQRFLNNKLAVLALLFLATAALGIPLLWKSPRFTPTERIVWAVVVAVYTLLIFWAFGAVMWWSYSRIAESFA